MGLWISSTGTSSRNRAVLDEGFSNQIQRLSCRMEVVAMPLELGAKVVDFEALPLMHAASVRDAWSMLQATSI